ncbi:MAG: 50S ribosomal protein L29 [Polyangiaceae bacterium]|nr:50S ribosomal protein L29 [Polyangiaceae bacterium]
MNAKDLRERPEQELLELRTSLRKDLFGYRMKNGVKQLADTSLLRKTRRDLARIESILGERSKAAASAAAKGAES